MKCTIRIPKGMPVQTICAGQFKIDSLTSEQWTTFTEITLEGPDAEKVRNQVAHEVVEWEKTHPRRTTI